MSEKKKEIIAAIGKQLPTITEEDKTYLIGFVEGLAAAAGNRQRAEAQQEGA